MLPDFRFLLMKIDEAKLHVSLYYCDGCVGGALRAYGVKAEQLIF